METCDDTASEQQWVFEELVMLKNGQYQKWLRSDNDGNIDITTNQDSYERWLLIPEGVNDGNERFFVQNYAHKTYLAIDGRDVLGKKDKTLATWFFRTKSATSSRYYFRTDGSAGNLWLTGTSAADVKASTDSTGNYWFRYPISTAVGASDSTYPAFDY